MVPTVVDKIAFEKKKFILLINNIIFESSRYPDPCTSATGQLTSDPSRSRNRGLAHRTPLPGSVITHPLLFFGLKESEETRAKKEKGSKEFVASYLLPVKMLMDAIQADTQKH